MNTYTAQLESRLDVLETELDRLNILLIRVGFPEGIETLKESVLELIQNEEVMDF